MVRRMAHFAFNRVRANPAFHLRNLARIAESLATELTIEPGAIPVVS